ncbi:MAG: DUF4105 domain-containing protein [Patescibacteria group bacterium]
MYILLQILKLFAKLLVYIVLILIIVFTTSNIITTPSNTRDWNTDQTTLPYADIKGNEITIYNVRNFTYASTTSFTENYYDKTFDVQKLKRVWYIVEPFSGIPGSAHTFLSFEFEDNQFVAVSVEIRKEKGESFHPVKGLFNQYELMYVWGDEKDLVKLRSNYRKDEVYVYPIKTTEEKARALFTDMIARTNELYIHPEFYNTVTNTCTTNIVKHVNEVTPKKIKMINKSVMFPESSDELAYNLGMIDTALTFPEARTRFHINEKALKYADDKDFSTKIRE